MKAVCYISMIAGLVLAAEQKVNVRFHNSFVEQKLPVPIGLVNWAGSNTQGAENELDLYPASFAQGDLTPDTDFDVNLHAPEESAGELRSAGNAILAAEEARAASDNAAFAANKKALMGGSSFLMPLAILGDDKVWQASLPTEVSVNFDVPAHNSFLKKDDSSFVDVFFGNQGAASEASYQALRKSVESALAGDLASLGGSFLEGKDMSKAKMSGANVFVDAGKGQLVDVERLRNDMYNFAYRKLDAIEGASFLSQDIYRSIEGDEPPFYGNDEINLDVDSFLQSTAAQRAFNIHVRSFLEGKLTPSDIAREAGNIKYLATGGAGDLPNAATAASINVPYLRNLASLMRKESTPQNVRNMAGSIITKATGQPVAVQAMDTDAGASVSTIVVPRPSRIYQADEAARAMELGARRVDV